ncbi:BrnA antitoxin family protein [Pararhodospirillum photometricum]|uniref:BrnA antitoxin family protein n=1 Tax=Pararhodospirillum photometricum TaxID=1084 RepID=UPI00030F2E66|nr:BrnA antitoxin family protein [Pararhodospirillum photometricum]
MTKNGSDSKAAWIDPDDAPELTEAWFADAVRFKGGESVEEIVARVQGTASKGGRPRSPTPKKTVNLRLDPDVLDHFRAQGPGWQTRINLILRDAAGLGPR